MPPVRLTAFRVNTEGVFYPLIFFYLAVITTIGVYYPGLSGDFLFDDNVRLSEIAKLGGIHDPSRFLEFIFGSTAGPTGRPIANASFLLADNSWPSDPKLFKLHNLLFHALTGIVLIVVFLEILYTLRVPCALPIAIIGGAIWLLHPFWVSTVMYVIQRMTILSALFTLTGLALYIHGRRIMPFRQRRGTSIAAAGIMVFTPLATLSKENGALLPLLALVLEKTIFSKYPPPPRKNIFFLTIYIPISLLTIMLVLKWKDIATGYLSRPFSLYERLLTESRILIDYLQQFFVPKIQTSGLFYDNYKLSSGFLSPPDTVVALTIIMSLVTFSILWRKKFPILAAAVLFFFAGHLLESTVIPLELYFEHRNYLPATFFALAASYGLYRLPNWTRYASSIALLIVLSVFTFSRASLWGDTDKLVLVWAEENPTSARAQQQAAIVYGKRGMFNEAFQAIDSGIASNPTHATLYVHSIGYICLGWPSLRSELKSRISKATDVLKRGKISKTTVDSLSALVNFHISGKCPEMPLSHIIALLDASLRNPSILSSPSEQQRIMYLLSKTMFQAGNERQAIANALAAYKVNPHPRSGAAIAALLATHGKHDEALDLIANIKVAINQGIGFTSRGSLFLSIMGNSKRFLRSLDQLEKTIRNDILSSRKRQKAK